ncbi:CHAT domain-containing protein [Variovorax sp. OV329]|uniref:CHAT domain-containing tetratricopeptide repeat protein n=1 Tax=Variovorax sp. OV329 TaxID=1882825 RepID=UPI0008F1F5B0|nr:CHAT domain-containing protein [Variovorax sp. OV329]SFM14656.1 Tetratricopeptide repeat-containing protein [Variovorax sp. OV329]
MHRWGIRTLSFAMALALAGLACAQQPGLQEIYALNRQAVGLLEQGRYEQAIATARQAVQQAERTLGPDHPGLAAALTNLGQAYLAGGQYSEAEAPMRRAIEIGQSSWGMGPADLGALYNNLGTLYAKLGRLRDAEASYRRALGLEDRIGTPHLFVATWLNNLAVLYIREQRYQDAWTLAEKSLVLMPERTSADPAVAETFSLMGSLREREGQYADARKLLQWALDIRIRAYGEQHPVTATSLHNLGMVLEKGGEPAQAEPLLLRALAIRERLPADHPELGQSLVDLALHYQAVGKPQQAQAYFERAFVNLRARLQQYFGFMSEDDRLRLLDDVGYAFPAYFAFVLKNAPQQPGAVGTMYDLVLLRKGMVAISIRALQEDIAREGDAQALELARQLRERRTLMSNLQRRGITGEAIERLASESADLERQLARRSASFASRQQATQSRWQAVRDALGPGDAAVEYVVFDLPAPRAGSRSVVALVLRRADTLPRLVELGDGQVLSAALQDYRRRAGLDRQPPPPAASTRGFAEAMWKPLLPALGGARRVYLAADDVLNQVAWAAVSDGDALLIEQVELRLLSSTRELAAPRQPDAAARTAVLAGNIDFGSSKDGRDAFSPLPGTRDEVAALARLLGDASWQVTTLEGAHASERRLKAVRHPRVLHVASHGFFERRGTGTIALEDPMLRSGLALAGANTHGGPGEAGADEDGVLTALEASALDLRGTELVVLSACETGLGQIYQGEGVFGLRRAFEQAGAQSVMMSMWKVPDEQTRSLMTLFYGKWLAGVDKHQALRDAQLELRRQVIRDWGRDRPQLWAAFILLGP